MKKLYDQTVAKRLRFQEMASSDQRTIECLSTKEILANLKVPKVNFRLIVEGDQVSVLNILEDTKLRPSRPYVIGKQCQRALHSKMNEVPKCQSTV